MNNQKIKLEYDYQSHLESRTKDEEGEEGPRLKARGVVDRQLMEGG
jgi:hypothetical protein